MRAVVVEDSRLAREGLVRMLSKYPEVDVIDALDNISAAIGVIEKERPDVLFLDIHLPEGNAFDLLGELLYDPCIIFTTAFSEYAIQSFSYQTVDYLLKPISQERLHQSIEKLKRIEMGEDVKKRLSESDRIMLKDKDESVVVPISDIFYIESCKNYVQIYLEHEKYFLKRPLSYVEDRLPQSTFFRGSRQYLVNINKIATMLEGVSTSFEVILHNGVKLEVSRRSASKLRSFLEF